MKNTNPAAITAKLASEAKKNPKNVEILTELSEAYLREGNLDEALNILGRAVELDPQTSFRSLYWEWNGIVKEQAEDYDGALDAYTKWAESDRDIIEPTDRLGALLVKLERWTDLIVLQSSYKRILEVNPTPRALESLALYYYILELLGHGSEDTSPLELAYTALETKFNSIAMRYLLGMLFMRMGHLDGAKAEFLEVLNLDKDNTWKEKRFSLEWNSASTKLMLGRIAHIQDEYEEAVRWFKQCLDDSEVFTNALEAMTSMLVEIGAYEDAKEIIEAYSANKKAAEMPWLRRLHARCLLGLGDIENAAKILNTEEEKETPKVQADPRLAQAQELLNQEKYQEALALFQAVKDDDKSQIVEKFDKKTLKKLDRAAIVEIDNEALVKLLQTQAELDAISAEIETGLAKAEDGLGKTQEATERLEKAVKQYPQSMAIWKQLNKLYKKLNRSLEHRLTKMQIQALMPIDAAEAPADEWIAPALNESELVGLGISARAFPGNGNLTVTGAANNGTTTNIAWALLKAEASAMGIDADLSRTDIHVHIREIDTETDVYAPAGSLPWSKPQAETSVCNDDIGLAVLLAMAAAVSGKSPKGKCAAGGKLDLQGTLYGSSTLSSSLTRLCSGSIKIDRLILPRSATSDLTLLPEKFWTSSDIIFCANAVQAVKQCLMED